MKCMTANELNAGLMLAQLSDGEQEVVVTVQGEPMALVVRVTSDDLEDTLRAVRQVRAQAAASRLRAHARREGKDDLTLSEIDEEIRAVRASRSRN